MLSDVVAHLACPHCGGGLADAGASLRCDSGHVFDVARQGYVNLLPPQAETGTADTPEMVAVRHELLRAGHYAPIADAVARRAAELVPAQQPGCVLEVGAGTAYYLSAVLERLPAAHGLALDISKAAARRAGRAHERIGAVVGDAWQRLPVRDAAATLALCVFAPRNAAELWRVLRPGAALLVVTPTPDHLAELVGPLGLLSVAADKPQRLATQLGAHFAHEHDENVTAALRLSRDDVQRIVMMGPSAWHRDAAAVQRALAGVGETVPATLSVTVGAYRRKEVPDRLAGSGA